MVCPNLAPRLSSPPHQVPTPDEDTLIMLEGASGVVTMMEGPARTIDRSLAGARPGIAVSTHARMRLPTAPAPCRAPPCFQASPT